MTTPRSRNHALDALRGFALLGILIINIQVFAMPGAAYSNPTAFAPGSGDYLLWCAHHILGDQKFMAIFSMLFGAGAAIFLRNARERGVARPRLLFFRRLVWLFVFGLLHAYLIWHGDILVSYALCGCVLIFAERLSTRGLVALALTFLGLGVLVNLSLGLSVPHMSPTEIAELKTSWQPSAAELSAEAAVWNGGWLAQMPARAEAAFFMHTVLMAMWGVWRFTGSMLLGMALFRAGFFDASESSTDEPRAAWPLARLLALVAAGLTLSGLGLYLNHSAGWSLEYSPFLGGLWNYCGSVLQAIGYAGLVLRFVRGSGPIARTVQHWLGMLGRTAFSGYIFQSIAAGLIFYGHGLGLYGDVSRAGQWLAILGIWAAQLLLTKLWLDRFTQGPLEALWRRLTYRADRLNSGH